MIHLRNLIAPVLEELASPPAMFAAAPTGPRPLVAVLDTGADWNHPYLAPHVWANLREKPNGKDDDANGFIDDVRGWSFADRTREPMDRNGQGTHCAGIVVQGGCAALVIKVLGDANWGQANWIAAGIRYAAIQGARVISLSLGNYQKVPGIADSVAWVQSRGCAVVAAAGNDGIDIRREPIYPACLPGVLSVGALDGAGLWSSSNIGAQIHAPGKRIRSTLPGNRWGLYSGTSMACPQVAAAVALVWMRRPRWTAVEVIERVMRTSDTLANVGRRLNLQEAIDGL